MTPSATETPGAHVVTIYVATTRERAGAGQNVFTDGRSAQLNYAEFKISVPPNHKAGNIEMPEGTPNPKTDFTTVSQRMLDKETFEREVSRQHGNKKPKPAVFVHGFNTNFQESLFRLVQLSADVGGDGDDVSVLFAWPSEASIAGYVADKEAVTFSRDRLVDLLATLGRNSRVGDVTVIGHSMGGWLTTEAVRQLRLTRQDAVLRKLKVILASPDIDVDVFRAQMAVIGPLAQPMTILVSKDDKALAVSGFLSGDRPRVGALDIDIPEVQEAAKAANVQIVDISAVSSSDEFNHNRYAELAALVPRTGLPGSGTGMRQAGAFVFNAVGATISSPFLIAGKVVGGR